METIHCGHIHLKKGPSRQQDNTSLQFKFGLKKTTKQTRGESYFYFKKKSKDLKVETAGRKVQSNVGKVDSSSINHGQF